MTKKEILKLKSRSELMKALATHKDIWDEELSKHLQEVSKNELCERFGSDSVIYTPEKRAGSK